MPSGFRGSAWQLPVVLVVRNGGGAAINVTVSGQAAKSLAAGVVGVFPILPAAAGDTLGDPIGVAYSGVTSVTVAAARLYSP